MAFMDYSSTEFNLTLDGIIRRRLLWRAQQAMIEETAIMMEQNNAPVIVHQIASDLIGKVEDLIPEKSEQ